MPGRPEPHRTPRLSRRGVCRFLPLHSAISIDAIGAPLIHRGLAHHRCQAGTLRRPPPAARRPGGVGHGKGRVHTAIGRWDCGPAPCPPGRFPFGAPAGLRSRRPRDFGVFRAPKKPFRFALVEIVRMAKKASSAPLWPAMAPEMRTLDSLAAFDRNARVHSEEQIEQIP